MCFSPVFSPEGPPLECRWDRAISRLPCYVLHHFTRYLSVPFYGFAVNSWRSLGGPVRFCERQYPHVRGLACVGGSVPGTHLAGLKGPALGRATQHRKRPAPTDLVGGPVVVLGDEYLRWIRATGLPPPGCSGLKGTSSRRAHIV